MRSLQASSEVEVGSATRAARGTKGPIAKLDVVGQVDAQGIKAAIDTPAAVPPAGTGHAATPAPAAPASPATAAPKAAGASPQS